MVNIPAPFEGTQAELEANIASHQWARIDGETRCLYCDCRRYGRVAMWPCGEEKRITVNVDSPEAMAAALRIAVATLIDEAVMMDE